FIGGFFLIEASGYDEAVALCRQHPHLEFGSVEIREIEPMQGR
ncbi:MAG: YCII-related domain, partial [Planctomycetota bacterium]